MTYFECKANIGKWVRVYDPIQRGYVQARIHSVSGLKTGLAVAFCDIPGRDKVLITQPEGVMLLPSQELADEFRVQVRRQSASKPGVSTAGKSIQFEVHDFYWRYI